MRLVSSSRFILKLDRIHPNHAVLGAALACRPCLDYDGSRWLIVMFSALSILRPMLHIRLYCRSLFPGHLVLCPSRYTQPARIRGSLCCTTRRFSKHTRWTRLYQLILLRILF
jgi:hypothetical protein